MTRIELETLIRAPMRICFDLSRSIELHQISTSSTKEKAIRGKTTGLCVNGDTITWRAKHFGIYHHLTMEITEMIVPIYFEDRMIKGSFKSILHKHFFEEAEGGTLMKDIFEYEVPAIIFGWIFNKLFLKKHMQNLLLKRNQVIREVAEGDWRSVLKRP